MHRQILIILIILFSIVPTTSALSPESCDSFSVALTGEPVKTIVSGSGSAIAIGGSNGMIGSFAPDGSSRWVQRINDPVTGIAISDDGRFIAATTFIGDLFYFDENVYPSESAIKPEFIRSVKKAQADLKQGKGKTYNSIGNFFRGIAAKPSDTHSI